MLNRNSQIITVLIISSLCILLVVAHAVKTQGVQNIENEATRFLDAQALSVEALTNKFAVLGALLARRPDVVSVYNDISKDATVINKILTSSAKLAGAKNIWLVNAEGRVVASTSNEHVGTLVSDKPYYSTAMEGRLGRATIVQDFDARSYIFASPVFAQSRVIGMVVVQIDLELLEEIWGIEVNSVVAVDKSKKIFLSNANKWRFKYLYQSADHSLVEDSLFQSVTPPTGVKTISKVYEIGEGQQYLLYYKYLPLLEWQLVLLKPYQPIVTRIKFSIAIATFVLLFAWLLYWIVRQRGLRREQEQQQQREFSQLLEKKVERRTEELLSANNQLALEVDERKHAEQELRKAQNELIQAAKMALIGQMSTELAHEYNQPIAAIKFYAENADALLDKKSYEDVKSNMSRIAMLTDRMSKLTGTLRTFAHKPDNELKKVDLGAVVDEVLVLMKPRAQKEQVVMNIKSSKDAIYVRAGNTRLVQVMTNLISNALDALKSSDEKTLDIEWREVDGYAEIYIKDTGIGIDADIKEKIFEAFYTTKNSGDGLGLGLFIVYNIVRDFHGMLELKEEEGYGTVFLLKIPVD